MDKTVSQRIAVVANVEDDILFGFCDIYGYLRNLSTVTVDSFNGAVQKIKDKQLKFSLINHQGVRISQSCMMLQTNRGALKNSILKVRAEIFKKGFKLNVGKVGFFMWAGRAYKKVEHMNKAAYMKIAQPCRL